MSGRTGIGLGLVPDGVGTRVSLLGNGQGIVSAVPGIGEGAVCRRDAGDQRLRIAVVGQLRICRSCQTGGLRGDGRRGGRGERDFVLVADGLCTSDANLFVRPDIGIVKRTGQGESEGIAIQQVTIPCPFPRRLTRVPTPSGTRPRPMPTATGSGSPASVGAPALIEKVTVLPVML